MLHQNVPSTVSQEIRDKVIDLEQGLLEVKSALSAEFAPRTSCHVDEQTLRRLLKARRLREQRLGANLFADPAWDILLELFTSELGQRRISVSSLCCASSVPPTTALRWISKLEQDGWLTREPDPLDARRYWVNLTTQGSERLRQFFEAVWPSILPL